MTFAEAKTYLANKLNITLADVTAGSNPLFSTQDFTDYLNNALKRAWDYKPWTFTQKAYKFTVTSGMITAGYIDYPNDFEDKSVFLLMVNNVPWKGEGAGKRDFVDYQKWFSDYPTDTSKLWAEFDRFVFFNVNAVSAGQEGDVFGKLRAATLSADGDLLPFSPMSDNNENSGNQAIVLLAYADALASDKKKNPTQAIAIEKQAFALLDNVWKPMGERNAQDSPQNRPFFNTGDYFAGSRNPWNTNIGNFP